ncbi:MAG: hypothetical protein UV64_C0006G0014 [Parcubacteria group bacterium GW2011_GWC1_43_11b]|uniref:Type 4 fimbrial biogenesis protein PilX N-terminal domain-containing protein n=2 Tax=Candidatus Vogeliibacteriota TaxID=1817922 RepID=A0A1G2QCZ3_9BACT|nr:MAG: hypothetical protein UV64_C0006G0014 [Parcubacteria group bacterium GW2011_GWC1_43_11b]KKT10021.1 MAG: hypothetical protein UV88_C0003G0023 [Parcubacteria group bacterium GW2011_GWA1_43_21]OHA58014.1 MAG: hypothetical protein A2607_00990 [Candidatus Vogelbacteria bacterium RIFOXYD1_FULL_42_15]OHA58357.1 MAG: hypothetical protein A2370_01430 [Candidatus Vogelbacteria bacterium RIFOXYB1_FULL_42_16]
MNLLNNPKKLNRAFVMLYALLVASIILSIGFYLSAIIAKQIQLSSMGKMSRVAYYAADAGRLCGNMWGATNYKYVSLINDYNAFGKNLEAKNINCNDSQLVIFDPNNSTQTISDPSPVANIFGMFNLDLDNTNAKEYRFHYDMTVEDQPACAIVSIVFEKPSGSDNVNTYIVSRGFSANCNNISLGRTVSQIVIWKP